MSVCDFLKKKPYLGTLFGTLQVQLELANGSGTTIAMVVPLPMLTIVTKFPSFKEKPFELSDKVHLIKRNVFGSTKVITFMGKDLTYQRTILLGPNVLTPDFRLPRPKAESSLLCSPPCLRLKVRALAQAARYTMVVYYNVVTICPSNAFRVERCRSDIQCQ